jgi:hypothetical protein
MDEKNKELAAVIKCPKSKAVFIGDICYALDYDIYKNVWGATGYADGVVKDDENVYALVVGTAYGDGDYESENEHFFPVDAGVIGITNYDFTGKKDGYGFGVLVPVPSGECQCELRYEDGNIYVAIYDMENNLLYEDTIYTD